MQRCLRGICRSGCRRNVILINTKDIQDIHQTGSAEIDARRPLQVFVCVIGDSEPGLAEHQPVVRSIADGHRLIKQDAHFLRDPVQKFGFHCIVDDLTLDASGQCARLYVQSIGKRKVETQFVF